MNAAAPIREICGAESEGFGASSEAEGFCGRSFAALADDVRDGNDGSSNCGTEGDMAQYPVNHWIVAGEPVISKNHGARWVERSNIKVNSHRFTGWK